LLCGNRKSLGEPSFQRVTLLFGIRVKPYHLICSGCVVFVSKPREIPATLTACQIDVILVNAQIPDEVFLNHLQQLLLFVVEVMYFNESGHGRRSEAKSIFLSARSSADFAPGCDSRIVARAVAAEVTRGKCFSRQHPPPHVGGHSCTHAKSCPVITCLSSVSAIFC
jgi:hypothetical protein